MNAPRKVINATASVTRDLSLVSVSLMLILTLSHVNFNVFILIFWIRTISVIKKELVIYWLGLNHPIILFLTEIAVTLVNVKQSVICNKIFNRAYGIDNMGDIIPLELKFDIKTYALFSFYRKIWYTYFIILILFN